MLIIDTREGKLIELIKKTPTFTIPYEIKNLQIGDIIISSNKYPEKSLIIERKCMTDMICSIKDGRYKEQKLRLQSEVEKSKNTNTPSTLICYLIEGIITDLRLPQDKTLLYGSIVSSIFRDNIPLIRTYSLVETLDIITRIHERMNKEITDFFKESNTVLDTIITSIPDINININTPELDLQNNTSDNNLYLQSIKKCKKENLTSKVWNQLALTNIPGISTNIAIKINEKYPTIRKLLDAYTICSNDDERIKLISEIILTETEKQKRRIGPVIAKRIFEYLYLDTQ
jgi:ERCC4-type nuclease